MAATIALARRAASSARGYTTVITKTVKERQFKTAEEAFLPAHPPASHVATPRPPPNVSETQAPNRELVWSKGQNPRSNAMRGPRFEQMAMELQPQPLAAIELIAEEPIRLVPTRIASCDGGGGALGHPKVYINLDKPGPKACGYCGIRFEREVHHH